MKPRVGPHYLDGKRYDPGDIIELHEYQIKNIMDKLVPVDPAPIIAPEPEPEVKLQIIEADDGWDVINELTGDPINDASLTLDQAKALAGPDAEIIETPEVDPAPLKAVHRGGGKYVIVWEETGDFISERLFTRSEASAVLKGIEAGKMVIGDIK